MDFGPFDKKVDEFYFTSCFYFLYLFFIISANVKQKQKKRTGIILESNGLFFKADFPLTQTKSQLSRPDFKK